MIRVATQCLPVTEHIEDVYNNADPDAVLALLAKTSLETACEEVCDQLLFVFISVFVYFKNKKI